MLFIRVVEFESFFIEESYVIKFVDKNFFGMNIYVMRFEISVFVDYEIVVVVFEDFFLYRFVCWFFVSFFVGFFRFF